MSVKGVEKEHIFKNVSIHSHKCNNDNKNYNDSSNIYPYFTLSGPLTSFTILVILFLVSTVTLGKPLLSVKKSNPNQSHYILIKLVKQITCL